MSKVMQFDSANFQGEVLDSTTPVLVDFWAPWCGPCKMIGPVIEELAGDFNGKVKVGKVNVDDNQQLAAQFGIRGIPTVMVFKGGKAVESFVGLQQKTDLAAALEDSQRLCDALRWLGYAVEQQGRSTEAEIIYRRQLAIATARQDAAVVVLDNTLALMETHELDVTELRKLRVSAKGELEIEDVTVGVMLGLVEAWGKRLKATLIENGPGWAFKTFLFVGILLIFRLLASLARRLVRKATSSSKLDLSNLLREFFIGIAGKAVMLVGFLIALSQLGFELGPILEPLAPYKDQLLLLKGVHNLVRGDGDNHMRGMSCLLTARELNSGNIQGGGHTPAGWASGISIDQEIRNFLQDQDRTRTRFGSLELGVAVPDRADPWTRMVYAGSNKPVAPIDDPYQVLGKLYGRMKDKATLASILDDLGDDLKTVSKKISPQKPLSVVLSWSTL